MRIDPSTALDTIREREVTVRALGLPSHQHLWPLVAKEFCQACRIESMPVFGGSIHESRFAQIWFDS